MKFIANPNKFFFAVGIGVLGFLLILVATALSEAKIICILLAPWLFASVLLAMLSHVQYTIGNQKFVVKHMGKIHEFLFSEIQQIEERTHCDNFGAKSYRLHLSENSCVKENLLTMQNDVFTKGLHKHLICSKFQRTLFCSKKNNQVAPVHFLQPTNLYNYNAELAQFKSQHGWK